jgi:hypothetical protein
MVFGLIKKKLLIILIVVWGDQAMRLCWRGVYGYFETKRCGELKSEWKGINKIRVSEWYVPEAKGQRQMKLITVDA